MENVNFKEFLQLEPQIPEREYSEFEVANMYFQNQKTVREISKETNRSMREVYRIVRGNGQPNRLRKDQHVVVSLADSGLSYDTISDFTGYSTRHVRNILKDKK